MKLDKDQIMDLAAACGIVKKVCSDDMTWEERCMRLQMAANTIDAICTQYHNFMVQAEMDNGGMAA